MHLFCGAAWGPGQCLRLALFVESLRCTISGAIGGTADMPRSRRARRSDAFDPSRT